MRKNMLKKLLAGMLVGTMLIGSLAGCGANEVNSSENTNVSETQKTSTSETQNVATEVVEEGVTYPLDSDETLTLAMVKDSYVAAGGYKDLSETPFFKAWTEATGVDVEVITVENDDAMSLMLAGDELPDMLLWVPGNYSGGASAMIKDEILSPLTWDELNKWAPDLAAAIGEDDVRRAVSTADGEVIGFPCLRLDSTLVATGGLMCRADWLEDLGLGVPTTPDELLTVLRAFKTEKGAEYPLALSSTRMTLLFSGGLFSSAFGLVNGSSYQIDGELHHGWAEPEYKDLLAFMHQLYEEELINPDYQTVNQATINAMIYDGRAGMTQHSIGGGMGTYLQTMADDPDFDLVAVGALLGPNGERASYGTYEAPVHSAYSVITTECKNKELAMKFLNYGYTEEGIMLFNYGVEGVSYEMVNGYPTYTDVIMKNPDGLTMAQALGIYARVSARGSYIQQKEYMEQFSSLPQQRNAMKVWDDNDRFEHAVPTLTVAEKDQAEYSKISADITTYQSEMRTKFITGEVSLDKFDEYLETLNEMGYERYLEIRQNALDEYNAR